MGEWGNDELRDDRHHIGSQYKSCHFILPGNAESNKEFQETIYIWFM